jgi:PAS domain-containing protein
MHATGGGPNGSGLEDRLRLIIVDTPDVAAPLVRALDVADIGAWMWVVAERALYFSPGVFELLGLAREPASGLLRRFVGSVHVDDQSQVRALVNGHLPGGRFRLRYRVTPPDGPLRWIEDRGRVERTAAGVLVRQGGALRDVTYEVGGEQERREADARLEALVNAIPFPVWGRSGPKLAITHQNAASVAVWGNLHGQQLDDAPADLRPVWEQQLADAMTGQIVRGRHEEIFGGATRTVDEIVAPVIVEDAVAGVVGVAIDVSEEARAARFQALLTEISADFAGRSTDTLDAGVVHALERIARFLGAPVAVLGEIGDGRHNDPFRMTHSWFDLATQREQPSRLEVDVSALGTLLRAIELNAPLILRSREELLD